MSEWDRTNAQRAIRDFSGDETSLRLRKPAQLAKDRAAFFVNIVIGSQGGSPTQRLARAQPWGLSYTAPPGRYGCFLAWDGGALVEDVPEVTLPLAVIEQVLETFRTGVIRDETLLALDRAMKGH